MYKKKTFCFDVKVDVGIEVEAGNEHEARAELNERVADYFAETEMELTKDEAKLVDTYNTEQ